MPRYERRAFLQVEASSEAEAERALNDVNGELIGDGVLVSLDDGPAELVDDLDEED